MSFGGLGLSAAAGTAPLAFLGGLALMLTTVAFKLALVPFHLWTPDVYEGAPAPVTAFIATISKLGVVAVILRLLVITDAVHEPAVELALSVVAAASMVIGNVLALRQDNIKRLLAYSSIAHFGYVLVIVVASGTLIVEATTFYLLAYVVTTLGAFAIVTVRSRDGREADRLDDYRGLWWERPWLAATFGAMLLSLAGIPLTAGFLAKFYVLAAAVETSRWWLAFVLIMNSVIGLYYYLRVIVVMLAAPSAQPTPERGVAVAPAWGGRVVLAAVGLAVLALGIYPQPVITVIRSFRLTPY
jgi:NADH-quinone oxidoreductase subunit N